MSATTLVRDFILGVQATLQDKPAFFRWPETEIVRAINYGQRALAKYLTSVGAGRFVVKLSAGTRQDLTKVLAADIKPTDGATAADTYFIAFTGGVRNMGADGLTPGRAIRDPVDRYSMDAGDPNWHTATADTVVREVVFDKLYPRGFYVNPPSPGSWWIEVQGIAEPKRVADGGAPGAERYVVGGAGQTDLLGIPDVNVDDLHNFVVAWLLLKGSKNTVNLPKAQTHVGLFTSSINTQAQILSGVSPNLKTLPFLNEVPK